MYKVRKLREIRKIMIQKWKIIALVVIAIVVIVAIILLVPPMTTLPYP